MNTFRIRTYSQWIAGLGIFAVLILGLGTILFLGGNGISNSSSPINLIIVILMVVVSIVLVAHTAISDIEIKFQKEEIEVSWKKKIFKPNRPIMVIQWSNIRNWKVEPDPKYELFRLVLKNGQSFTFRHKNKNDEKDDYKNFLFAFRNEVDSRNRLVQNEDGKIVKGKTIYEGQWRYPLVVLSILLLLSPLLYFLVPEGRHPNIIPMLVVYPAAIFILHKVFSSNNQR